MPVSVVYNMGLKEQTELHTTYSHTHTHTHTHTHSHNKPLIPSTDAHGRETNGVRDREKKREGEGMIQTDCKFIFFLLQEHSKEQLSLR